MVTALTGCSISITDGPAEPLFLKSRWWAPDLVFSEVSADNRSTLYRVSRPAPEFDPPVFASALRSCTIADGEELPTVARRLFVGLENLRIIRRDSYIAGDLPLLLLAFEATLDASPLEVVALSTVSDGCAVDLAFWSGRPSAPGHSFLSGGAYQAAYTAMERLRQNDGTDLVELTGK